MFVSYLIESYLLLIIYRSIGSVSSHPLLPSHCNYTIDKIEAITNFTNGSLFVSSGQNYWVLRQHEKPIHSNAMKISDLLPEVTTLEAVVNIKIKTDKVNNKCVPVKEQLLFYSQNENDSTIINIYEDDKWTVYRNASEVEYLNAAKSVNWSQPIDAIGYYDKIIVIFQGDLYISIQCENGQWRQVVRASIPQSFGNIPGPLDSANFIQIHSALEDAYLYMFKKHNFFICPLYGADPCNGPLSIVDDFFRFDKDCGLNPSFADSNIWLVIIVLIIIMVLVIFLVGYCCYILIVRSRQITFWVNRRRTKTDRNHEGLTYEALNGQTEGTIKPTEMKVQTTNGNNGLETNLDDQTNTPFIDSNGKDEEHKQI